MHWTFLPQWWQKPLQRCAEEGPKKKKDLRDRPGQSQKLTEEQVAHIIVIACSEALEGHAHWTLLRLASKVVELPLMLPPCSHEMIRQLLKKHSETRSEGGTSYSRNQYGVRGTRRTDLIFTKSSRMRRILGGFRRNLS